MNSSQQLFTALTMVKQADMLNTGLQAASWLPGPTGIAANAGLGVNALRQGKYLGALGHGLMAGASFIPGGNTVIKGGLKLLGKIPGVSRMGGKLLKHTHTFLGAGRKSMDLGSSAPGRKLLNSSLGKGITNNAGKVQLGALGVGGAATLRGSQASRLDSDGQMMVEALQQLRRAPVGQNPIWANPGGM